MTWNPWLSNLNDALADLYPDTKASRRIITAAGLKTGMIDLEGGSLVRWFNILRYTEAAHGDKPGYPARAVAILEQARRDFPDHDILLALQRDEPPTVKGADLTWVAPTDAVHYEQIIGAQTTLLPIRFLEIGTMRARSVARIVRHDRGSGTGFLIGGGWMLTNNHVLPTADIAHGSVAEFNYQQTADGTDAAVERFTLDASRFRTSAENDWTAVGVEVDAETRWGVIPLEPANVTVDAYVNIIQHPGGGPKQIGMYHNTVAYVGNGRVQYLTDTLPGSSGSPVFDCGWRVVALHHSGGMLREPGTKTAAYRNEGIAITTVIEDLRAAGVLT